MKVIIREAIQKIKSFEAYRGALGVVLIILCLGAAFTLGRLSGSVVGEEIAQEAQIGHIEARNMAQNQVKVVEGHLETKSGGGVVASKTGSKYHFPWCSGAKRISPENLITFSNQAEAERAGYTKAGNCAGL